MLEEMCMKSHALPTREIGSLVGSFVMYVAMIS